MPHGTTQYHPCLQALCQKAVRVATTSAFRHCAKRRCGSRPSFHKVGLATHCKAGGGTHLEAGCRLTPERGVGRTHPEPSPFPLPPHANPHPAAHPEPSPARQRGGACNKAHPHSSARRRRSRAGVARALPGSPTAHGTASRRSPNTTRAPQRRGGVPYGTMTNAPMRRRPRSVRSRKSGSCLQPPISPPPPVGNSRGAP